MHNKEVTLILGKPILKDILGKSCSNKTLYMNELYRMHLYMYMF